jgi:hypothetical protein
MVLDKSSLLLLIIVLTAMLLINIIIVFLTSIYQHRNSNQEFLKITAILSGSFFSLFLLFVIGFAIRAYLESG